MAKKSDPKVVPVKRHKRSKPDSGRSAPKDVPVNPHKRSKP